MTWLACARHEPIPRNFTPGGIGPVWWYLPHVQVGLGDLWRFFGTYGIQASAHGWVGKDGTIVQYVSLSDRAWAEAAGNPNAYAFETEGYDWEPHTQAQLEAHARILAEIHPATPSIALAVTDSLRVPGVGTHRMGGAAWGGHSCPGDARAAQRPQIVAMTNEILGGHVAPITFPTGPWLVATYESIDAESAAAALDLGKRYGPDLPYQPGFSTHQLSLVAVDPSRPNDWPIAPGSITVGFLLVHDASGRWVKSADPFHESRPPAFGAIFGTDGLDTAHRIATFFGVR